MRKERFASRQFLSTLWSFDLFLLAAEISRRAARPERVENSHEAAQCAASEAYESLRKPLCPQNFPGTAKPIFYRSEDSPPHPQRVGPLRRVGNRKLRPANSGAFTSALRRAGAGFGQ